MERREDAFTMEIPYKFLPKKVYKADDGTYWATAFPYIDRKDVQNQLDFAAGPGNWGVSFEIVEESVPIVKCTLRLTIPDSAGHQYFGDFEDVGGPQSGQEDPADKYKAACTDALKRAATHVGIGRFLYDLPIEKLECEAYERDGRVRFLRWKENESTSKTAPPPSSPPRSVAPPPAAAGTPTSEYSDGPYPCKACKGVETVVRETSGKGKKPPHEAVWCKNPTCSTASYRGYSYPLTELEKYRPASPVPASPVPDLAHAPSEPGDDDLPF